MKTLILIDLSAIFWSNWHATADMELSEAFRRTVDKVRALAGGYDHAAVCVDAPPYWRKEILPAYKAQRDAPPPNAVEQLTRVKERLASDGFVLWASPGFEADDVIASAAARFCGELDITIATADKDLLQLVSEASGIRWLSTRDGAVLYERDVEAKFGVPPSLIGDFLALMGDASDNVPGVDGVGPKTSAALLKRFGSLRGVFESCDKIDKPKLQEAVFSAAELVRKSRQVIALRTDVPLDFDALFRPQETKPLTDMEPESMDQDDDMDTDDRTQSEPPPAPSPPALSAVATPLPTETAALARVEPACWNLALEPQSIGAAYKLATGLYNSRLYSRFPNPEAIWAVIIRGREMGLGALTSLDVFHVVEGKPVVHAHAIVARCKKHPDCEWFQFVGGDSTYAEYATKNRKNPKPTPLRYKIEDARQAGLIKQGSNWEKRPAEMLRKTCAVQLGRIEYPDAAMGLYAAEELGGDE